MNSGTARQLFLRYAGAVAYVSVQRPDDSHSIGTAFHIGEGVFVTARHVVENVTIRSIAITETAYIELTGEEGEKSKIRLKGTDGQDHPFHVIHGQRLDIEAGPFFHPDTSVDVAAFKVLEIDSKTPFIKLGDHLDDWLGPADFVLDEVVVLGYPPIPFTNEPYLMATRSEVNAQVDLRDGRHPHFVLSGTPRGGFSGAPAITESGIALGIVTRSLLKDNAPEEFGFFTVLSVEPIYNCVACAKLLPHCQAAGWDDFWNSDDEAFFVRGSVLGQGGMVAGSVDLFDDGRRLSLTISCYDDRAVFNSALAAASELLDPHVDDREHIRDLMIRLTSMKNESTMRSLFDQAREKARNAFISLGLVPSRRPDVD